MPDIRRRKGARVGGKSGPLIALPRLAFRLEQRPLFSNIRVRAAPRWKFHRPLLPRLRRSSTPKPKVCAPVERITAHPPDKSRWPNHKDQIYHCPQFLIRKERE